MPRRPCLALMAACLAAPLAGADLAPGVVATYYEGVPLVDGWPQLDDRQPTFLRVEPTVDHANSDGEFAGTKLSENFAARWRGVLRVAVAGTYGFATDSDDGSRLSIDGTVVVDNGGMHPAQKKSGSVELTAGDHALVVDFFQGGGGAECRAFWTPPGGAEQPLPAEALAHDPALERVAWDEAAWKARRVTGGPPWVRMDYGPFLCATIETRGPSAHFVDKAIAIRFAEEDGRDAGVVFDTDLLAYAAGWTGGFLELKGVAFNGAHGDNPRIGGDPVFAARAACGGDSGGAGAFVDPRSQPHGPLPREVGRFRAIHVDGRTVTLAYDLGGHRVVESPSLLRVGDERAFARRIDVSAGTQPLRLLVAEVPRAVVTTDERGWAWLIVDGAVTVAALVGAPAGASVSAEGDGLLCCRMPAAGGQATLVVWSGPGDLAAGTTSFARVLAAAPAPEPLAPRLTRGGAPRWNQPIVTRGVRAKDDRAYVVDTLTLPDDNPWSSWLRLGGLGFFSDGRIAVCTWSGDVWIVSGVDDALGELHWRRYATGLFQPLGLAVVDDVVYVHGRDRITRLRDLDGDGEADLYESFNDDVIVTPAFHEFAFDLQTDAQGNFYFIKASPVRAGGRGFEPITASHGCLFQLSPDGERLATIATGFRAPNGIGVGPHGELTSGDNEGTWTPACRLNWIERGGFYGVVDSAHRAAAPTDYDKPLCWLPMAMDNSSGGQAWAPAGWGALGGQLLHTSYGSCSLFSVLKEKVGARWQGGVVRVPCEFQSGIMRPRFDPHDGQLYVCGLKGWQTRAQRDGCLQRVRATDKPARLPIGLHVAKDTVAVTFTDALDADIAGDPANWRVQHWNYRWSDAYGSPDLKPSDGSEGRETLTVTAVAVSADGLTATLTIPSMVPVMQQTILAKIATADGEPLECEIAHTIHELPER